MTPGSFAPVAGATQYRRGAIMGLTVAEAFMLVAFILLMLLLFWRYAADDAPPPEPEVPESIVNLPPDALRVLDSLLVRVPQPVAVEIIESVESLPEAELDALRVGGRPVGPEALERLAVTQGLSETELDVLRDGGRPVGPEALERLAVTHGMSDSELDALRDGGRPVGPEALERLALTQGMSDSELDALRDGGRPVGPEALERLAVTRGMSDSELDALRDGGTPVGPEALERLAATRGMSDSELDALRDGGKAVGPEELERLDALGKRSASAIVDAFELKDALDPYGEYGSAEIAARIDELMSTQSWVNKAVAEETAAAAELMHDLQAGLEPQIAQAGGRLEPGGRIVFPEKFLFARGASGILPEFAGILDRLCPTWLETLMDSSAAREVESVLIEGHSSSEWTGARSAREAWVRNLELSQRRAQSVLVHCLNTVQGTPLGDWSRLMLAATGFSSSRPIRNPAEEEDPEASRRVVFGVAFSREQFFDTIRAGPAPTREGLGELRGRADVKDADTIGIDGYNIRLDGIDALEKNQTCVRDDGTVWDCGERSRRAVEAHLAGKEVVCNRLSLGLGRFRGRCRADGEDLNGWVVRQGWAFAYLRFSDDYAGEEDAARRARRGAWAGEPPTPPWEWRRSRRESGS